jgi:transcriptional regulator with XRE-family HTH domain
MTMTDHACAADQTEMEIGLAEERFLVLAQTEMQRLLNNMGIKHAHLAKRLGVSEARVSQMFGDDANNLTIRTIAKVFHQLNEQPLLIAKSELERRLAEARGAADPSPTWTFAGLVEKEQIDLPSCSQVIRRLVQVRENSRPATGNDWISAERAVEARKAHAA